MIKSLGFLLAVILTTLSAHAIGQVQIRMRSDYEAGVRQHDQGNIKMAIKFFEQGAAKGDPKSEFALGTYYHFGEEVEQDYAKARALFEKSAAAGYAPSNAILGIVYRDGQGVAVDKKRAADYLTKAAYACSDQAQDQLAHMLYTGEGISLQKPEALAWLYLAARSNKNAAQGVDYLEKELSPEEKRAAQARKAEIESKLKCSE